MSSIELLPVGYGLASAATWGTADFIGGVATKRTPVYSVIVLSQMIGGLFLLALAIILGEAVPSLQDLLLGGLAGISGAVGLVALYTSLAKGQMGVVSPVAALITAILPVMVSLLSEGLPAVLHLLGFGLALIAVWFLSRGDNRAPLRLRELQLPVTAGIAFGVFFVLIDRVSASSILWPLVAARCASVTTIAIFALTRRALILPDRSQLLTITLAGIFDSGGNVFFALATRFGRLDISAVVASLYPAGTVLLAWLFLRERLARLQWAGVCLALLALVIFAS